MRRLFLFAFVLCSFLSQIDAYAADFAALESQVAELKQMVLDLRTVVTTQQQEITALKQNGSPKASGSPSFTAAPKWTPEIGVVGDMVARLDSPKEDSEGADRLAVRELELVLGSAVDPYSRLDATIALSDFEEVNLEEAYLTRFDLPGELTARIGRFKPRIGKAIPAHRDSLDTVDEPLVIEKWFGVEGYSKSGIDFSRAIELPWSVAHQVSFGVLEGGNGEEGTLFGDTRRHPTIYAHLKNYVDLNDVTGLELGLSGLTGSRDDDSTFEVEVLGIDATLIHRYGDQREVKLQSEVFRASRSESFYSFIDDSTGETFEEDLDDARNLLGGYALLDWRFHPQWATGARFDDVQLIETSENFANPGQTERGYTGYLTFYQSEFARWRVQYSHLDLTDGEDDNRVFIQGTFAIGEHKHKLV